MIPITIVNGGWMLFNGKTHLEMDDLEVAPFFWKPPKNRDTIWDDRMRFWPDSCMVLEYLATSKAIFLEENVGKSSSSMEHLLWIS